LKAISEELEDLKSTLDIKTKDIENKQEMCQDLEALNKSNCEEIESLKLKLKELDEEKVAHCSEKSTLEEQI
jgi:septal ring factor EnvC (AmiA/AmiB activator)